MFLLKLFAGDLKAYAVITTDIDVENFESALFKLA